VVGLNKIMVIGNAGTDPEMRYTPNGNPVTSFRIATTRTYTTGGERREETEWFTVVSWNQLAEKVNQFVVKGKRVYVEGRFQSHSWEGQDGGTRTRNEIVANTVLFLDRAPGGPSEEEPVGAAAGGVDPEDLPF
jgi:single-strand DNA-binding protein